MARQKNRQDQVRPGSKRKIIAGDVKPHAWSIGDAFGTVDMYKKMPEEEINLMFQGSKIFTKWSQHINFLIFVLFKASILLWYYYLDGSKNPHINKWAYAVKQSMFLTFFEEQS